MLLTLPKFLENNHLQSSCLADTIPYAFGNDMLHISRSMCCAPGLNGRHRCIVLALKEFTVLADRGRFQAVRFISRCGANRTKTMDVRAVLYAFLDAGLIECRKVTDSCVMDWLQVWIRRFRRCDWCGSWNHKFLRCDHGGKDGSESD